MESGFNSGAFHLSNEQYGLLRALQQCGIVFPLPGFFVQKDKYFPTFNFNPSDLIYALSKLNFRCNKPVNTPSLMEQNIFSIFLCLCCSFLFSISVLSFLRIQDSETIIYCSLPCTQPSLTPSANKPQQLEFMFMLSRLGSVVCIGNDHHCIIV